MNHIHIYIDIPVEVHIHTVVYIHTYAMNYLIESHVKPGAWEWTRIGGPPTCSFTSWCPMFHLWVPLSLPLYRFAPLIQWISNSFKIGYIQWISNVSDRTYASIGLAFHGLALLPAAAQNRALPIGRASRPALVPRMAKGLDPRPWIWTACHPSNSVAGCCRYISVIVSELTLGTWVVMRHRPSSMGKMTRDGTA